MLTDVIRAEVVRGVTVKPNELKSAERNRLEQQAINSIMEYSLVKNGVTSYEALGYGIPDQGVMAYKLYEYLVIDEIVNEAQQDRKK